MSFEKGHASQSALLCGLKGTCPRCGGTKIFAGFLTLAPRCSHCEFDFSFADSGDGPAVFVSLMAAS